MYLYFKYLSAKFRKIPNKISLKIVELSNSLYRKTASKGSYGLLPILKISASINILEDLIKVHSMSTLHMDASTQCLYERGYSPQTWRKHRLKTIVMFLINRWIYHLLSLRIILKYSSWPVDKVYYLCETVLYFMS